MNKKQAAITSLLLLLMGALFMFQIVVKDNFYNATLVDNDMGELKEYNITNSNIVYSLPASWTLSEKENNSFILYHGDFKDDKNGYKGYIELINSDRSVEDLANSDNNNSTIKVEIKDSATFKTNIGKGMMYNQLSSIKKGYSYRDLVYYVKVAENRVVKANFTVRDSEFKDNNIPIYDAILSYIKVKDK